MLKELDHTISAHLLIKTILVINKLAEITTPKGTWFITMKTLVCLTTPHLPHKPLEINFETNFCIWCWVPYLCTYSQEIPLYIKLSS